MAGCAGCGSTRTVTMDGKNGRRCGRCLPPGMSGRFAADVLAAGGSDLVAAGYRRTLRRLVRR